MEPVDQQPPLNPLSTLVPPVALPALQTPAGLSPLSPADSISESPF